MYRCKPEGGLELLQCYVGEDKVRAYAHRKRTHHRVHAAVSDALTDRARAAHLLGTLSLAFDCQRRYLTLMRHCSR